MTDDERLKIIEEAIELCWCCDNTIEFDLLYEIPKRPFDWLYKNLRGSIIRVCVNDNPKLLRACHTTKADKAAKIIFKALWDEAEKERLLRS